MLKFKLNSSAKDTYQVRISVNLGMDHKILKIKTPQASSLQLYWNETPTQVFSCEFYGGCLSLLHEFCFIVFSAGFEKISPQTENSW